MDQMVEIIERLGEETDLQGFDLEYTVRLVTNKVMASKFPQIIQLISDHP